MKKILLFFIFLFLNTHEAHIAIIPYPYTNREYPLLKRKTEKEKFFFLAAVPFFRYATEGFEQHKHIKNISCIFHGNDYFEISDLSPEQKILFLESNKNSSYKKDLSQFEYMRYEGKAQPYYKFFDMGIVLGADVSQNKDSFSYKLQIRVPVIKREILHERGWSAITYNDIIEDERLNLENFNKHFFVRTDYLFEHGIMPPITRRNGTHEGITFTEVIPEDYFLLKENPEKNIIPTMTRTKTETYEDIPEQEMFAITKFTENAQPTEDSINFFTILQDTLKIDRNNILKNTTKGNYLGKSIDWGNINTTTFGPFDIQLGVDYPCMKDKGLLSGLLSFVLPLNQKEKNSNYLAHSFFEDHYGVRLGSQFSYAINRYYKLVAYGSWQHNFSKTEMIPAVFENQTAFGLNPLYLKGKTSWNELFFAADLVIAYNKTSGGYLGYEFFKKTKDNITPQLTEFHTVNGEVYPLNYTTWEKFTDSAANILVCSLYTAYKQVNLNIEYKGVITGKNIMNMQEINCKISYNF